MIKKAFKQVDAVGSATVIVGVVKNNTLNIANIGDSCLMVIRFKNNKPYCVLTTKEQ